MLVAAPDAIGAIQAQDVGVEVGQHHRCEGSGGEACELENFDALEGSRACFLRSVRRECYASVLSTLSDSSMCLRGFICELKAC